MIFAAVLAAMAISFLSGFVDCMTGPVEEVTVVCQFADINNDGHVDLLDFSLLQNQWKCAIPEGCEEE